MSHIPTGDATTASRPATPPNHLTETRGATQPALADSLEVPPTSVAPSSGGPPLNDSAITATAAASADARETTSATPAVRFAAVEPTAAEAETTSGRDPRVVSTSDEDLHLSLDSQPEEVADLFNRSQRPPVSVATPAHTDTMKFSYAEPSAFPLSAADHRSSPLHEAGESRRTANPSLNTSSRMNHRKNSATMKKFFSTSLPPASPSPPPPPPSTAIPAHLADLAAEIHNLDEHDLLLIADLAHDVATKGVYSLLPYTGANWFLPAIREKTPDEPPWGVNFSWSAGLLLYVAGRRLSIPLLNLLLRLAFLVLVWFTLWAVLPSSLVEPGGVVWDPVVLVVICALVGGLVCRIIQIPPLVGVLWMGIFWNNVPHLHALTASIAPQLFSISSKIGLSVILARAGFSLSLKGIAPHWRQTALLCTLPFVIEGVSNSLIAAALFGYTDDYRWAFLQGMLCSIASPAVVVPSSLYLQELGYGRGVGPLSLMLSSVGLEIVLGVWTVNFIISLIFGSVGTAVLVVLGPVQLVGGVLLGIVLGLAFHYIVELIKGEAKRLPSGRFQREHFYSSLDFSYLIFIAICVALVSAGYKLRVAAGGSVTCVFFSSTVAQLWLRGANPEREEQKRYFGAWLAATWDHAVMPILFAFMGARIDIKSIFSAEFFPKAVVCLVCSTVIRIIVIFMVQLGSIFSWKERFLVCVGYLGKASAQASMGPLALEFVNNQIDALAPLTDPTLNEWLGYATNVEQISAMYVMFMAAVASVGLLRGGLAMLVKDENAVKSVPPSAPPAPSPRQPRSKQQKPSPTKARSAFEDAKGSDSELSTPQAAPVASRSPRRVRVEDGGGAIPHRRRRADLNTESRIDTPLSPLRNTDSPRVVELSSLPRIPQSMQHPRNNGTLTGKRPCGGPAGVSNAKNDLLESYLESSGYYVSSPARNSSSMASTHPALTPTSPLMHSAEVWEQSSWVPERPGSRGEAHPSLSPPDQTAMVEVPSLKVC